REAERRRVSVLSELHVGKRAARQYRRNVAGADLEFRRDARHAPVACCRPGRGSGHLLALLYDDPPSGAGSGQPGIAREDRPEATARGRAVDVFLETAAPPIAAAGSRERKI